MPKLDLPEEDEDVAENVESLEETVSSLEQMLQPFFAVPLHELTSKLENVDNAKLHITMAYAINTLFYSKQHEF